MEGWCTPREARVRNHARRRQTSIVIMLGILCKSRTPGRTQQRASRPCVLGKGSLDAGTRTLPAIIAHTNGAWQRVRGGAKR